ncbi:MAG: hypothetical protein ACTTK0_08595 [Stomatobaculum sp.]
MAEKNKRKRMIALLAVWALVCSACGGKTAQPRLAEGTETVAMAETGDTAADSEEGAAANTEGNTEINTETNAAEENTENYDTASEGAAESADGRSDASLMERAGEGGASSGEESAPEELTVTAHKQEGRHMVTAGALTISVPTTFEGLEQEGAEFQGDRDVVKGGASGSCRVKYRGGFGSIRIHVKNNQDYSMAVRDCTIKGIEVGSQEADPALTLYGIPMGATRAQVAEVYGEPFSKTFDDASGMSNMVYQFGDEIYSNQVVMIFFRNGKAVAASYDDFSQIVK